MRRPCYSDHDSSRKQLSQIPETVSTHCCVQFAVSIISQSGDGRIFNLNLKKRSFLSGFSFPRPVL